MALSDDLYDRDFYAWANTQAALLRAGRLGEADIRHIAEEIESMGRTEQRELTSRLRVLLLHLLKWQFQPERRGASWEATIVIQRRDLARHLRANPSLAPQLPETLREAYDDALVEARAETGLALGTFPSTCPWSAESLLSEDFWPGGRPGR